MSAFFAMGGYAGYVWPAYGIAVGGIALMLGLSWRDLRAAERRLAALERGGRRRRSAS